MRHILALDPGKATGLSTYDRETDTYQGVELDFKGTCRTLLDAVTTHGDDLLIVSESFIITQQTVKNTQAPWSLELIGVARMMAQLYTGRDLVLQAPASAKRFMSDERLKMLGWYQPRMGHSNDSARHLGLLMANRGWFPKETLEAMVVG